MKVKFSSLSCCGNTCIWAKNLYALYHQSTARDYRKSSEAKTRATKETKGCYCLHYTSVTQCYCLIKRATVPARLGPSHCREMPPQKDVRINVPVLKWTHSRSSLQASSTQVFLFPLLYNAQFLHTDRLLKHTRLYSEYSLFMDHGLRTVKWLDYFVVYMAHALGNGIN